MLPDRRGPFAGWERADSIVVNPHKWLFTPLDASLLLTRRMDVLRAAFSLVPEYLRTLDREAPVRDYNEYTPQLGRRFRALKLWMLSCAGSAWKDCVGGSSATSSSPPSSASAIDADPDWELLAPVPFSTVCFRWRPAALAARAAEPDVARRLDEANAAIMDAVNRDGRGLPVAHSAGRTVHDPASRSATFGRRHATSIEPGNCSVPRPPTQAVP